MKRCDACGEEFESKFRFCPVDGKLLAENKPTSNYEYRLTLISERSLARRLVSEGHFLIDGLRQGWPQFKAEPGAFTVSQLRRLNRNARRIIKRPYFAAASTVALTIIGAVIVSALLLDYRHGATSTTGESDEDLVPTVTIDLREDANAKSKPGVGADGKGRVGFNKDRGEGSGPKPARAQGGGGGGELAQLQQSQGRLPRPSVIPAPIPTTYARLPQTLPEAGINIDPVLWKDLPFRDYGDPRSKSTVPSNGSGKGGGIGTGEGTGIGEGDGTGFGPGKKRNIGGGDPNDGCCGNGGAPGGNNPNDDPNRVFRVGDVTSRARVLSKPEPQYTEEARRGGITGTVTLSAVFSRTGQVTDIRAVQSLCCGLTEKAISAARQIRFVPATRDGRAVSTYMELQYNFNLY